MSDKHPERIAHFEIIRLVGRGGMGVLYQARDTVRNREVALKVMSADILEDEEARARFRQEAQLAARQHRNIVKVFEFGEDGDVPFIAMEFLRGQSLADRLASGDPIPFETKLDIVTQVCDGLQCLHEEGIVHRDVKPANIWLLEDGGVKLLDLGVAKHGSLKLTQYGNVVGSVAYIAPEQLSGARVDGRADIFSAGVVLFEILSGQRPFHADSITAVMMKVLHEPPPDIRALVPGLPGDVVRAVETALQKDPAERYMEAAEFASDLRLARAMAETAFVPLHASTLTTPTAVLASTMVTPREQAASAVDPMLRSRPDVLVPASVRTPAESRRVPALVWAAAAVAAVAVAGIAGWVMFGGGSRVELDVRSKPAGAATTVGGAETGGRTPAVLQVNSDPPGGRIILEGNDTGSVTPAAAASSSSVSTSASAKPGPGPLAGATLPATLPAALSRETTVRLSGPYRFEVSGCGTVAAAADTHVLSVTAPCKLHLRAPTYWLDADYDVVAVDGGRVDYTVPPLVTVVLRTRNNDCKLLIGERDLGSPPVTVEIAAGSYSVTLKCPDQTKQTKPFQFGAGKPVNIDDYLIH